MKSRNLFLIISLFFTINQYAQNAFSVSGSVNGTKGENIAFANFLLVKSADSTLVRGGITMEDGSYLLDRILPGNYLVISSMIGYQSVYSKAFSLNQNYKVEILVLIDGEALDEVVINATKPLYQQKTDRMVINVENSILSAGSSALEILERSPGVLVDRQGGNISLIGKSGVVIMINGKRSYQPASSVVTMLEGMSADNIESLELITTPPANFDAEGNAGFINIVMKERTGFGLNGAYSFKYGYGGNTHITSDNINFNYRKEKLNIFGNYSYVNTVLEMDALFFQQRTENNNILTTSTISNRDPTKPVSNARLGLDYNVSDKTIMGILLDGYDSRWSMDALTNTISAKNGIPTSYVQTALDEVNHWKHFGVNYNIRHDFTKNKFISVDIDYLYYKDNNPVNYLDNYFDEDHVFLYEELTRSRKLTPIKRWVGKFDFSNQINDKVKFETGIKGAFSTFENAVSFENFINNEWHKDITLTSNGDLEENIYAAYTSLSYAINDKWSAKFGLRYEYTDSKLDTDTKGRVVDKQYGQIFPTVFFNRKFNDALNMNFSYTKRIARPTFNDMAPFFMFFGPNTVVIGNVAIQPAISNSVKYDINYKSTIFSLQYTHEDSSIVGFQPSYDTENDKLILRSENLDYTKTFSATLGFPLKISEWWRSQNNLTYANASIGAFNNENKAYTLNQGYLSANTANSFKISDSFSSELTALYKGPSYNGTGKNKENYRVDIGFLKKFNDKWGAIKFAIDDVFDSYVFWDQTTYIPTQNLQSRTIFKFRSNRVFSLTYSRSFGNSKLKSQRNRKTGSEEERGRVK